MRTTEIDITYDPDANAAYLRLDPRTKVVTDMIAVAAPGVPESEREPFRLAFDAEGRLHGIEFLMPEVQLPPQLIERLGIR